MPIYEYICDSCDHELEEVQKFSDLPLVVCPQCGREELTRKMSVSAFHLKGGGWYKDGYNGSSNESPSDKTNKSTSSTKSEKPSSDSKKSASSSDSSSVKSSAA